MPQPAVIVEWWGSYDTLNAVRGEVEAQFEDGQYLLCMALREENPGGRVRCRHLIGWVRHTIEEHVNLPAECNLNDDGCPTGFYLGWAASHYGRFTGPVAEWALIRELEPECNDMPAAHPPGWDNRYCVSVTSWFYTPPVNEEEALIPPPPGFPPVVTYNGWAPD